MLHGIPNKREILATAFQRLGLLRLLEQTLSHRRPGVTVLTYHRIAEPGADRFYDPVISATPESFRAEVDWLRKHVRLLTLDDLIGQVESGSPWREPAALLTFDDGYRDNFDVAAPILRERNIPATFFIPSAFLQSPALPWWDHVAYVIKRTQIRRLVLDRNPPNGRAPLELDLETQSRSAAIATVIGAFLDATIADERAFLDHLSDRAAVSVDSAQLGRDLFMTWDQARQLASAGPGFTIGSHGHSHRPLARLDHETQFHELADSKRSLEARLGCPIKAIAYPYGWPGSFTMTTKSLAARAGYRLAFSSREGINRLSGFDPYDVKRLGVGSADSAPLLRGRCALHAAFGRSFL